MPKIALGSDLMHTCEADRPTAGESASLLNLFTPGSSANAINSDDDSVLRANAKCAHFDRREIGLPTN